MKTALTLLVVYFFGWLLVGCTEAHAGVQALVAECKANMALPAEKRLYDCTAVDGHLYLRAKSKAAYQNPGFMRLAEDWSLVLAREGYSSWVYIDNRFDTRNIGYKFLMLDRRSGRVATFDKAGEAEDLKELKRIRAIWKTKGWE